MLQEEPEVSNVYPMGGGFSPYLRMKIHGIETKAKPKQSKLKEKRGCNLPPMSSWVLGSESHGPLTAADNATAPARVCKGCCTSACGNKDCPKKRPHCKPEQAAAAAQESLLL
jgi:hypothetical protein